MSVVAAVGWLFTTVLAPIRLLVEIAFFVIRLAYEGFRFAFSLVWNIYLFVGGLVNLSANNLERVVTGWKAPFFTWYENRITDLGKSRKLFLIKYIFKFAEYPVKWAWLALQVGARLIPHVVFFIMIALTFLSIVYPLLFAEAYADIGADAVNIIVMGFIDFFNLVSGLYNAIAELFNSVWSIVLVLTTAAMRFIMMFVYTIMDIIGYSRGDNFVLSDIIEKRLGLLDSRALREHLENENIPYDVRYRRLDFFTDEPMELGDISNLTDFNKQISSFIALILSILSDVIIIVQEIILTIFLSWIKVIFSVIKFLMNIGCCISGGWCCIRELFNDILPLDSVFDTLGLSFLGRCDASDFPNKESVCKCGPLSDNGGNDVFGSGFYLNAPPCDETQFECRLSDGLYSEYRNEGRNVILVASSTNKRKGCPHTWRDLEQVGRQRRLNSLVYMTDCSNFCIRGQKGKNWKFQRCLDDTHAIYMGSCNANANNLYQHRRVLQDGFDERKALKNMKEFMELEKPKRSVSLYRPHKHKFESDNKIDKPYESILNAFMSHRDKFTVSYDITAPNFLPLLAYDLEKLAAILISNLNPDKDKKEDEVFIWGPEQELNDKDRPKTNRNDPWEATKGRAPRSISEEMIQMAADASMSKNPDISYHASKFYDRVIVNHRRMMLNVGYVSRVGLLKNHFEVLGELVGKKVTDYQVTRHEYQKKIRERRLESKREKVKEVWRRKLAAKELPGNKGTAFDSNYNRDQDINLGVFTNNGDCPYLCPDLITCKSSRAGLQNCPVPAGGLQSFLGWFTYVTMSAQNFDVGWMISSYIECWNDYSTDPSTDPTFGNNLRRIFLKGEYPPQVRWCFPLFRELPLIPRAQFDFKKWLQGDCQDATISQCRCPQYEPIRDVMNYDTFFMAGIPVFVEARIINSYRILQYYISAFTTAIGFDAIWEYFWRFWTPGFPEKFFKAFNFDDASAGLGFDSNFFCQVLHSPSLMFFCMFIVWPAFALYKAGFFNLIKIIALDIFWVFILAPLETFFNFLDAKTAAYMELDLFDYRAQREAMVKETFDYSLGVVTSTGQKGINMVKTAASGLKNWKKNLGLAKDKYKNKYKTVRNTVRRREGESRTQYVKRLGRSLKRPNTFKSTVKSNTKSFTSNIADKARGAYNWTKQKIRGTIVGELVLDRLEEELSPEEEDYVRLPLSSPSSTIRRRNIVV